MKSSLKISILLLCLVGIVVVSGLFVQLRFPLSISFLTPNRPVQSLGMLVSPLAFDCGSVSQIPQSECNALVAFYNSTGGAAWTKNAGWLDRATPCTWFGITCINGHVTTIELIANNLNGTLPAQLANLGQLEVLKLNNNKLHGEFPAALSALIHLRVLYLGANQLTGSIPAEIGSLSALTELRLFDNQLSGSIPKEVGNLTKLIELALYKNQLSGTIPSEIGNLLQLKVLTLTDNKLSNQLPEEMGNLTELTNLQFSNNTFSSTIPASFGQLQKLEYLEAHQTGLTGTIPSSLGNLTQLQTIGLGSNNLSGAIPNTFGNLKKLTTLYLVYNQLSGELPNTLTEMTALQSLDLTGNQISGAIPATIGNLTQLKKLAMPRNKLSGELPSSLGQLNNLLDLHLHQNQLTGTIPPTLGNLTSLGSLRLSNNQLSGSLPSELGQLANLTEMDLYGNQLTGVIPTSFGRLKKLDFLGLAYNQLSGGIPIPLTTLPLLRVLDLRQNPLGGALPPDIGNLKMLASLWLGGTQLTGTIPSTIGNLSNLTILDLSTNSLQGTIPIELATLAQLNKLFLNTNQLNGQIPPELGQLAKLTVFQLTNNRLEGPLPSQLGDLASLEYLDLQNNKFIGTLPASLGNLVKLKYLAVPSNNFEGPLPSSLVNLAALQSLYFQATNLCEPTDSAFQNWLGTLPTLQISGFRCPPTQGDTFEDDNLCTSARMITSDGVLQEHTFHQAGDVDWVRFEAVQGAKYQVEALTPADSTADVEVGIYPACATLGDHQAYTYTPDVRIEFESPSNGAIFVKLNHLDPAVGSETSKYSLSVRTLSAGSAVEQRALILVAGTTGANDPAIANIYHIADQVRQTFKQRGYSDEQIYYLAPNPNHPNVDKLATNANFAQAITEWASQRITGSGSLTVYLVDHGSAAQVVYLDKSQNQMVSPEQLNGWLDTFQQSHPEVVVNVIIEACYAGTFISKPNSISRPNRVVIASTTDDALAWTVSQGGAHFSDHFLKALAQGESIYSSFEQGNQAAIQATGSVQHSWVDGDGDGTPNEQIDANIASQRGFDLNGTLQMNEWSTHIFEITATVQSANGVLQATVRDDNSVAGVWALIYPPSYQAPTGTEQLVQDTLTPLELTAKGGDLFESTSTAFKEAGNYRIVIYAEDQDGFTARPKALQVKSEEGVGSDRKVFLPFVVR